MTTLPSAVTELEVADLQGHAGALAQGQQGLPFLLCRVVTLSTSRSG